MSPNEFPTILIFNYFLYKGALEVALSPSGPNIQPRRPNSDFCLFVANAQGPSPYPFAQRTRRHFSSTSFPRKKKISPTSRPGVPAAGGSPCRQPHSSERSIPSGVSLDLSSAPAVSSDGGEAATRVNQAQRWPGVAGERMPEARAAARRRPPPRYIARKENFL